MPLRSTFSHGTFWYKIRSNRSIGWGSVRKAWGSKKNSWLFLPTSYPISIPAVLMAKCEFFCFLHIEHWFLDFIDRGLMNKTYINSSNLFKRLGNFKRIRPDNTSVTLPTINWKTIVFGVYIAGDGRAASDVLLFTWSEKATGRNGANEAASDAYLWGSRQCEGRPATKTRYSTVLHRRFWGGQRVVVTASMLVS